MKSFVRVTLADNEVEYTINLDEVALITKKYSGTQIVFTGLGEGFGWLHDKPAGDGGIIVKDSVEQVVKLDSQEEFVRVTPIETWQDRILEGPETFVRLSAVKSIYKSDAGPKNWITFNSFYYISEGEGRKEQLRSCVLGVRETADQIVLK